jgi:hypothetical protein
MWDIGVPRLANPTAKESVKLANPHRVGGNVLMKPKRVFFIVVGLRKRSGSSTDASTAGRSFCTCEIFSTSIIDTFPPRKARYVNTKQVPI